MSHGLIIGKFMPPHLGHQYLVDFGLAYTGALPERGMVNGSLTVLVCTIPGEPIPGIIRYWWMTQAFPHAQVVIHSANNPQEPADHPDFWKIWRESIRELVPSPIDYVFASDAYGDELARQLDATFVPVDGSRISVPVSGTAIRENPMRHWNYIHPIARSYFAKSVAIVGPESTGKTTMVRALAKLYQTGHAEEYARGYLERVRPDTQYPAPEDLLVIAKGQKASSTALLRQANKVMLHDTDVVTTAIWNEILFGKHDAQINDLADQQYIDLRLVLDDSVPLIADPQRYGSGQRQSKVSDWTEAYDRMESPYVVLTGDWDARYQQAIQIIDKVIS